MSTIQLPGLATGIDTQTLIAQLMAIERRTITMYETRKETWDEKEDALSDLESKLSALQTTVSDLSDEQKLRAYNVASSDSDIITAEASYNAFEGNHSIIVNQLAAAERWVHTSGLEYAEDLVGEGTFIYSYNHKEAIINTTADTTLSDLVGLINNDADNPGVTAGLLYYNDAYHLVLSGNDAGTDYEISINASSTESWQMDWEFTVGGSNATLATKITELDQFDGTLGASDTITISGTDKSGSPINDVELTVTENTRIEHLIGEINDAFEGIAKASFENGRIILTDDTYGASDISIDLDFSSGTATLTLPTETFDWDVTEGGSTVASLTGFEEADFTETQQAQDSQIRVDGFPNTAGTSEVQMLSTNSQATSGTFTLTYGVYTTGAIAYDATIEEIQAALEALPNVSEGDITVSGDTLDVNNAETMFTFSDNLGDVPMISIDTSGLTPSDPANYVFTEETKGVSEWISRSSNTIDDVLSGVTLHLHDTTDANGEQITLTRDVASIKEKINKFVEAYNEAMSYIKEKTGYNDVLKTAGVLMGDFVVRTIKDQISSPLYSQTDGFIEDIDTFLTPGHIGFELDRDGMLSFDSSVFDEAIAEDYLGVLALLGADKSGSSDNIDIKFYGASSDYTTAGSYQVKVVYDGSGNLSEAYFKLSTESDSAYRAATIIGNVIVGDSTFDDDGNPVYGENSLQVTAPTTGTPDSTVYATIRVKQGFTGAIEDTLDRMLKATTGSIQIDQEHVSDQIKILQDKIDAEEKRLEAREERLIARFARLEKTLTLLQSQLNYLNNI